MNINLEATLASVGITASESAVLVGYEVNDDWYTLDIDTEGGSISIKVDECHIVPAEPTELGSVLYILDELLGRQHQLDDLADTDYKGVAKERVQLAAAVKMLKAQEKVALTK